jgi:hypothetical protein
MRAGHCQRRWRIVTASDGTQSSGPPILNPRAHIDRICAPKSKTINLSMVAQIEAVQAQLAVGGSWPPGYRRRQTGAAIVPP